MKMEHSARLNSPEEFSLEELDKINGFPLLKRFKMMQKRSLSPVCCLPAKKRICASRDFISEHQRALEDNNDIKGARESPSSEGPAEMSLESPRRFISDRGNAPDDKDDIDNAERASKTSIRVSDKLSLVKPGGNSGEAIKEFLESSIGEADDDDDGVICSVCGGCDGDVSDPIVFCDGCDLMVHVSCYGDPLTQGVPVGDWFCEKCSDSYSKDLRCLLCPFADGAMKRTTAKNSFAHLVCALLVPEVFFHGDRRRIDCSKVPSRRWEMRCSICKSTEGACIECSESKCKCTFHVSCGLRRDLCIEYREIRSKSIVIGFCEVHTPKWRECHGTGKFSIVPRYES